VSERPAGLERDVIAGLRLAALVLAIDAKVVKDRGATVDPPDETVTKIVTAGAALGLWSELDGVAAVGQLAENRASWERLMAVLRHQLDYLRLLAGPAVGNPTAQASSNPHAYLDFLRGVDVGHAAHAQAFAELAHLRPTKRLLDLGGGLGAFSRAWVESGPQRTAVLADLAVLEAELEGLAVHPRIRVAAVDLLNFDRLPSPADVILLSNVLHLLRDWRDVLGKVVDCASAGTRVCVFEASPDSGPGALFDLQVHIRSGWRGGLMLPAEVTKCLERLPVDVEEVLVIPDPEDPYRRDYRLWIARR
jgi:hypothetical protein